MWLRDGDIEERLRCDMHYVDTFPVVDIVSSAGVDDDNGMLSVQRLTLLITAGMGGGATVVTRLLRPSRCLSCSDSEAVTSSDLLAPLKGGSRAMMLRHRSLICRICPLGSTRSALSSWMTCVVIGACSGLTI